MSPRAGLDTTRVVDVAIALADEAGLEALTLAAVADRLGVRTPSLYNFVTGLQGLRREMALRGMRELAARLGQAAIAKSGDDALRAAAGAYRDFVLEHPGWYASTVRSVERDDPPDRELQRAGQEVIGVILRVLESYGLHGEEALHAVRGLRSTVHGFATLQAAGGFGLALDLDESFRRLLEMYIRGLRQPEPPVGMV